MKIVTPFTTQPIKTKPLGTKQQTTDHLQTKGYETYTKSKEAKEINQIDTSRIWSLHLKKEKTSLTPDEFEEYHTARKSNESLDRALYERDKAKALEEIFDIQLLILKALRGEKLTEKEKKMIEEDPMLKQEIEMRKAKQRLIDRYH